MSYLALDQAAGLSIPHAAKAVLMVLCRHADRHTGICYPHQQTIACELGVSRRTVIRKIQFLASEGYVDVKRTQTGNQYRVLVGLQVACDKDVTCHPPCDSGVTPEVSPVSLPFSMNKSINTSLNSEGAAMAKKRTPAPDDDQFELTDQDYDWLARKGITTDVNDETEQFLDHHRAKGSLMADWKAAWRTWMRNSMKFNRRSTSNGRQGTSAIDRVRAANGLDAEAFSSRVVADDGNLRPSLDQQLRRAGQPVLVGGAGGSGSRH